MANGPHDFLSDNSLLKPMPGSLYTASNWNQLFFYLNGGRAIGNCMMTGTPPYNCSKLYIGTDNWIDMDPMPYQNSYGYMPQQMGNIVIFRNIAGPSG